MEVNKGTKRQAEVLLSMEEENAMIASSKKGKTIMPTMKQTTKPLS